MIPQRRVIAYVDGFNFYYRRLRNKPYRWLDLHTFFSQFFPNDHLVQVRYFTAHKLWGFMRNVTEVASLRRSSLHISNLERAQVMY